MSLRDRIAAAQAKGPHRDDGQCHEECRRRAVAEREEDRRVRAPWRDRLQAKDMTRS